MRAARKAGQTPRHAILGGSYKFKEKYRFPRLHGHSECNI